MFTRFVLAGCGIKTMWPIFKTEMVIYHSKTNLDPGGQLQYAGDGGVPIDV